MILLHLIVQEVRIKLIIVFAPGESSSCEEIVYLLGDYNSDGTIHAIDVTQAISLIINANLL